MTRLRQQMLEELQRRNYSQGTIATYNWRVDKPLTPKIVWIACREVWGNLLVDPGALGFAAFLRTLFRQDWVVYAKPAFGSPAQVLRYLGRYTHRVAISNHRLIPHRVEIQPRPQGCEPARPRIRVFRLDNERRNRPQTQLQHLVSLCLAPFDHPCCPHFTPNHAPASALPGAKPHSNPITRALSVPIRRQGPRSKESASVSSRPGRRTTHILPLGRPPIGFVPMGFSRGFWSKRSRICPRNTLP